MLFGQNWLSNLSYQLLACCCCNERLRGVMREENLVAFCFGHSEHQQIRRGQIEAAAAAATGKMMETWKLGTWSKQKNFLEIPPAAMKANLVWVLFLAWPSQGEKRPYFEEGGWYDHLPIYFPHRVNQVEWSRWPGFSRRTYIQDILVPPGPCNLPIEDGATFTNADFLKR